MGGCSGPAALDTNQLRSVILNGADAFLLLRIPPFVRNNPMSARITSGKERSVPRSRSRIGIIVITIREVCPAIHENAKASRNKLIVVPLQIVPTKLIDHNDHNKLGMSVISGSKSARCEQMVEREKDDKGSQQSDRLPKAGEC